MFDIDKRYTFPIRSAHSPHGRCSLKITSIFLIGLTAFASQTLTIPLALARNGIGQVILRIDAGGVS
jgi:hypothetical protein